MVSHWSLSDSKSFQVSRTLLSILANLKNAVVWMVSTCHLISKSSSPFINPLGIVPSSPITIGITVTFMFHSFSFSSKVKVLVFLFAFFYFYSVVCQDGKGRFRRVFFLFFFWLTGRLAETRWSVYIPISPRNLWGSFSWIDSGLSIYHLFVWSFFLLLLFTH